MKEGVKEEGGDPGPLDGEEAGGMDGGEERNGSVGLLVLGEGRLEGGREGAGGT